MTAPTTPQAIGDLVNDALGRSEGVTGTLLNSEPMQSALTNYGLADGLTFSQYDSKVTDDSFQVKGTSSNALFSGMPVTVDFTYSEADAAVQMTCVAKTSDDWWVSAVSAGLEGGAFDVFTGAAPSRLTLQSASPAGLSYDGFVKPTDAFVGVQLLKLLGDDDGVLCLSGSIGALGDVVTVQLATQAIAQTSLGSYLNVDIGLAVGAEPAPTAEGVSTTIQSTCLTFTATRAADHVLPELQLSAAWTGLSNLIEFRLAVIPDGAYSLQQLGALLNDQPIDIDPSGTDLTLDGLNPLGAFTAVVSVKDLSLAQIGFTVLLLNQSWQALPDVISLDDISLAVVWSPGAMTDPIQVLLMTHSTLGEDGGLLALGQYPGWTFSADLDVDGVVHVDKIATALVPSLRGMPSIQVDDLSLYFDIPNGLFAVTAWFSSDWTVQLGSWPITLTALALDVSNLDGEGTEFNIGGAMRVNDSVTVFAQVQASTGDTDTVVTVGMTQEASVDLLPNSVASSILGTAPDEGWSALVDDAPDDVLSPQLSQAALSVNVTQNSGAFYGEAVVDETTVGRAALVGQAKDGNNNVLFAVGLNDEDGALTSVAPSVLQPVTDVLQVQQLTMVLSTFPDASLQDLLGTLPSTVSKQVEDILTLDSALGLPAQQGVNLYAQLLLSGSLFENFVAEGRTPPMLTLYGYIAAEEANTQFTAQLTDFSFQDLLTLNNGTLTYKPDAADQVSVVCDVQLELGSKTLTFNGAFLLTETSASFTLSQITQPDNEAVDNPFGLQGVSVVATDLSLDYTFADGKATKLITTLGATATYGQSSLTGQVMFDGASPLLVSVTLGSPLGIGELYSQSLDEPDAPLPFVQFLPGGTDDDTLLYWAAKDDPLGVGDTNSDSYLYAGFNLRTYISPASLPTIEVDVNVTLPGDDTHPSGVFVSGTALEPLLSTSFFMLAGIKPGSGPKQVDRSRGPSVTIDTRGASTGQDKLGARVSPKFTLDAGFVLFDQDIPATLSVTEDAVTGSLSTTVNVLSTDVRLSIGFSWTESGGFQLTSGDTFDLPITSELTDLFSDIKAPSCSGASSFSLPVEQSPRVQLESLNVTPGSTTDSATTGSAAVDSANADASWVLEAVVTVSLDFTTQLSSEPLYTLDLKSLPLQVELPHDDTYSVGDLLTSIVETVVENAWNFISDPRVLAKLLAVEGAKWATETFINYLLNCAPEETAEMWTEPAAEAFFDAAVSGAENTVLMGEGTEIIGVGGALGLAYSVARGIWYVLTGDDEPQPLPQVATPTLSWKDADQQLKLSWNAVQPQIDDASASASPRSADASQAVGYAYYVWASPTPTPAKAHEDHERGPAASHHVVGTEDDDTAPLLVASGITSDTTARVDGALVSDVQAYTCKVRAQPTDESAMIGPLSDAATIRRLAAPSQVTLSASGETLTAGCSGTDSYATSVQLEVVNDTGQPLSTPMTKSRDVGDANWGFDVSSLDPGTYGARARAKADDAMPSAETVAPSTVVKLQPPRKVTATGSGTTLTTTWKASHDTVGGYTAQLMGSDQQLIPSTSKPVEATVLTATLDTSVLPADSYQAVICAALDGALSSPNAISDGSVTLLEPPNDVALVFDDDGLVATWSSSSSSETTKYTARLLDAEFEQVDPAQSETVKASDPLSASFDDASLLAGDYNVDVRAKGDDALASQRARCATPVTKLAAPSGVTVALSETEVTVTVTLDDPPAGGTLAVQLLNDAQEVEGSMSLDASAGENTASFSLTDLPGGSYAATAQWTADGSMPSDWTPSTGAPVVKLTVPADLSLDFADGSMVASWSAVHGASGYSYTLLHPHGSGGNQTWNGSISGEDATKFSETSEPNAGTWTLRVQASAADGQAPSDWAELVTSVEGWSQVIICQRTMDTCFAISFRSGEGGDGAAQPENVVVDQIARADAWPSPPPLDPTLVWQPLLGTVNVLAASADPKWTHLIPLAVFDASAGNAVLDEFVLWYDTETGDAAVQALSEGGQLGALTTFSLEPGWSHLTALTKRWGASTQTGTAVAFCDAASGNGQTRLFVGGDTSFDSPKTFKVDAGFSYQAALLAIAQPPNSPSDYVPALASWDPSSGATQILAWDPSVGELGAPKPATLDCGWTKMAASVEPSPQIIAYNAATAAVATFSVLNMNSDPPFSPSFPPDPTFPTSIRQLLPYPSGYPNATASNYWLGHRNQVSSGVTGVAIGAPWAAPWASGPGWTTVLPLLTDQGLALALIRAGDGVMATASVDTSTWAITLVISPTRSGYPMWIDAQPIALPTGWNSAALPFFTLAPTTNTASQLAMLSMQPATWGYGWPGSSPSNYQDSAASRFELCTVFGDADTNYIVQYRANGGVLITAVSLADAQLQREEKVFDSSSNGFPVPEAGTSLVCVNDSDATEFYVYRRRDGTLALFSLDGASLTQVSDKAIGTGFDHVMGFTLGGTPALFGYSRSDGSAALYAIDATQGAITAGWTGTLDVGLDGFKIVPGQATLTLLAWASLDNSFTIWSFGSSATDAPSCATRSTLPSPDDAGD